MSLRRWVLVAACLPAALPGAADGLPAVTGAVAPGRMAVNESARRIPVAYDVDVVVVGGSTAGVAAAVAAAQAGARVFVAAPRPYLGEDLCGTYRLWLEPGEEPSSPLAKALFEEGGVPSLEFTYEADLPSSERHADTQPPSVLCDGEWGRATTDSVQYDGDVTITLDLGAERRLRRVLVKAFQERGSYAIANVGLSLSADGREWMDAGTIANPTLATDPPRWSPIDIPVPVEGRARHLRLTFRRPEGVSRLLLGEILVEGDMPGEPSGPERINLVRPMQVKRVLEQALLEAGVPFLYNCCATDVLRDRKGSPAGIVMANRACRQAVKAKVILDATARAEVARLAGASFRPYPGGPQSFTRVVVGGPAVTGEGVRSRRLRLARPLGRRGVPPEPAEPFARSVAALNRALYQRVAEVTEYTLTLPMKDGSFASFAEAEQAARDLTFHPEQVDESETLFQVPPDPMKGVQALSGPWPGAGALPLGCLRPDGIERLFVLGGCADLPREAAGRLLRPLEAMAVGERVGAAAGEEAKRTPTLKDVRLRGKRGKPVTPGDVRETLTGVRPIPQGGEAVRADARALPVLGVYDVVVVGGGTGGAPAGIGAARRGAKVLVVECLYGLGGVGTLGLIGQKRLGSSRGFTVEADEGIERLGAPSYVVGKMEWWRRENRKAGADIWLGTLGCGAFVEGKRVKGVVVATPQGRGVVLARCVVDSTGNSDVAAAAGAECVTTDASSVAMQGTGLPPRQPGAGYTNTDWTFVDDTDVLDAWAASVVAKQVLYPNAYDLGQLIDTRERRRIVGDLVVCPLDVINRRTYADAILVCGQSTTFDTHGYTSHALFMTKTTGGRDAYRKWLSPYARLPYRCLLPKGIEGILVTGLGISAHRDAITIFRMQPDVQNQGYAAGVAAAMAAQGETTPRAIDARALQRHLVAVGNLPEEVLSETDSPPLPDEVVADAVKRVAHDFDGLAAVLAEPERSLPLLRAAWEDATTLAAETTYAHILGMMGDATGVETLLWVVGRREWDEGWKWTGGGQFGTSMSELDSLIIALGRTRDRRALEPILEKVAQLGPANHFSHHRAVALALETLADRRAARPLAELLSKPGMSGHAFTSVEKAMAETPAGGSANETRDRSLRELLLARALTRCGDHDGLGRQILEHYTRDVRGHYARHAAGVLKERRR